MRLAVYTWMTGARVALDCGSIERPSLATIEHIARLRVGLKRGGCELCLGAPSEELLALIALAGLSEVLLVETEWQAEQRKEPGRVEEERELPNPPV